MRRAAAWAVLAAATVAGPASAGPEKQVLHRVAFVGLRDGPVAPLAEEAFLGAKTAFASGDAQVEFTREDPPKPGAWPELFSALDKKGVEIVFAYAADGETAALEKASEKAKLPLIVLSPEPTRADLDPTRYVFWAGGLTPTDEALYAMDFLLQPLSVRSPAIFHDGSARAVLAAGKCARQCHSKQTPRAPVLLPVDFDVTDAKGVVGFTEGERTGVAGGADGFLYFGGPAGAERLVAACAAAGVKVPVLLGQHLVTRAVPTFAAGKADTAWGVEPAFFEDYGGGTGSPAPADAKTLAEAAQQTGGRLYAQSIRAFRAARWVQESWRNAASAPVKGTEKKFIWALRHVGREEARGKLAFEKWGWATLVRLEGWRSAKTPHEPACARVNPMYVPITGIPQIGAFQTSRFQWEPDTYYVWCHWGKSEERTIEQDLEKIGLDPGRYEEGFRSAITDDLLARTMSRLNRLFLRNADGTAIPGVSFNVTFGTVKEPKGMKQSRRFEMVLRGDHEFAGGVAHGMTCEVFTTHLQRTMYAKHALTPPVSAKDRPYSLGSYKWGTSLPENLRGDAIRALADGFTQACALTGAHECGHMFGCGHDEENPRSLMNVLEAVGLDFDWAEWIPSHEEIIESRIGRVPAAK